MEDRSSGLSERRQSATATCAACSWRQGGL